MTEEDKGVENQGAEDGSQDGADSAAEAPQDGAEGQDNGADGDGVVGGADGAPDGDKGGDDGGADKPLDWRSLIQDESLRKSAEKFTSLDDAIKGIANLQREISDRIKLPGKDADEKEVAKFRKALGIPDAPDGYKLELPEDAEMSDVGEQLFEAVKPVAHDNNIPAKALNQFAAVFEEFAQQAEAAREKALEEHYEAAVNNLKKEWGPKDYDANVNIANHAMAQFGGDDFVEYLNKTEVPGGGVLANDPNVVKFMARLGRHMSEDGVIQPVEPNEAKSLEEKRSELTEKIHEASDRGDRKAMDRLVKEREAITARLVGE